MHRFLEAAGFTDYPSSADTFHEILVELAGALGWSGRIKRRAFAAANVAIKGELRDDQDLSTNIRDCQIHLSVVIFEDSETDEFVGEIVGI